MKLALFITLTVFGYALCEQCTTNMDCTATSCGTGSSIICQHDEAAGGVTVNGGLCTCADSATGECVTASDCYGNKAPNLNCADSSRHCYDNKCICDRFPIGGKRSVQLF